MIAQAVSRIRSQITPTLLFQIHSGVLLQAAVGRECLGLITSISGQSLRELWYSSVGRDTRQLTKIYSLPLQASKNREKALVASIRGVRNSLRRLQTPPELPTQVGVTGQDLVIL